MTACFVDSPYESPLYWPYFAGVLTGEDLGLFGAFVDAALYSADGQHDHVRPKPIGGHKQQQAMLELLNSG